jgi:ribosome recycling factor
MADVRAEFNWKATKKIIEEKMQKCIEHLQSQFNTIRAGGANPMMLDRLMVNNMGTPKPLNQLARISTQNAYQLLVEPFDVAKIKEIEKAITTSDLGVTPNSDGYVIRINIPPLTEERRKDLVKQAKAKAEDGKVSLRNVRRDFVEKVKQTEKDKHIGKDESKNYQEDIQKVMETFVKKVDELLNFKEKDLSKL